MNPFSSPGPTIRNVGPFQCKKCHERYLHPRGRCAKCGYSIVERAPVSSKLDPRESPVLLSDVELGPEEPRVSLGVSCLDWILGGGAVRGYSVLCSGGEGLGKSTLLLEATCRSGLRTLYATSEEETSRLAARAKRVRLPTDTARAFQVSDAAEVLRVLREDPYELLVLDSIQTCSFSTPEGVWEAGNHFGQLALARAFHDWAHRTGGIVFLVCHETKEGDYAGPRALAHAVDATIGLGWPKDPEPDAEEDERCLFVIKNRAGAAPKKMRVCLRDTGFKEVTT